MKFRRTITWCAATLAAAMMLPACQDEPNSGGGNGNNLQWPYSDGKFQYNKVTLGAAYNYRECALLLGFAPGYSHSGALLLPGTLNRGGRSYGVAEIGLDAFEYENGITSVTIPQNVLYVGASAFEGCANMTELTVSDGDEPLEVRYSVNGCNWLDGTRVSKVYYGRDVTFSSGMGSSAFEEFEPLETLTIGGRVVSLPFDAFRKCSKLRTVNFGNSMLSLGTRAFWGCTNLTSINLPASLQYIDEGAFYGCTRLVSVSVPDKVDNVGPSAFAFCSKLKQLQLGRGVEYFDRSAIENCTSLSSITCMSTVPPVVTSYAGDAVNDFGSNEQWIYSSVTLHVPAASLSMYRSTLPWSRFKDIRGDK